MNKTYSQKPSEIERTWLLVDASELPLGRLATIIATKLIGKDKPTYTPHIDGGDYVVVTNVEKIVVTGKKLTDKVYYNHSGFPGGIRARKLGEILAKKPEELLMLAVKRMLPKNKLGRQQLTRLRVFAGAEHSHVAQKPNKVEL